jgi:hypothetical protein
MTRSKFYLSLLPGLEFANGRGYAQDKPGVSMAVFAFSVHRSITTEPERGPLPASPARVRDLIPPGGASLDEKTREHFGSRLGFDFSRVRIHSGTVADTMARSVQAHAYTLGEHVVFRAGRFAPDTSKGQRLLAHELVHVAQGSALPTSSRETPTISHPHDPAEREADETAARIVGSGGWAERGACTTGATERATTPYAPPQSLAPVSTRPVDRRPTLHRTAVGGNAFGNWDVDQVPMSATGTSHEYHHRIRITFEPDAGTVDSPEIGFVQAAQVVRTGAGTWALPAGKDISKRVSSSRWSIDSETKRGWVGYNDANNPFAAARPGGLPPRMVVEPGSSPEPLKKAVTRDWPGWSVPNLSWSFNTAAVARRGPDSGAVYGSVTWGFEVDAANKVDPHQVRFHNAPGPAWQGAVAAWNKQAKGPVAGRVKPDQQALPEVKLSP